MRQGYGNRAEIGWIVVLVVATGATSVGLLGSYAVLILPVCILLAGLAGRWLASLRTAVYAMTGATLLTVLVMTQADPDQVSSQGLSIVLLALVGAMVPWWFGRARRLRIEQTAREQRLADQGIRLSERNRIARDMHDSLGHDLALIALRSGAWELAVDASPEQRAAAAEVRSGATAATERLHAIIGVLGADQESGPDRSTDLEAVVEQARQSGVNVELHQEADVTQEWSPDVARAAHSIVQEAITNATKHAPGSRITITIDDAAAQAVIEVINSPATRAADRPTTGGQGLIGLDERLRLLGGHLEAKPRRDGFVVRATLPRLAQAGRDVEPGPVGPALTELRRQGRTRRIRAALLPGLLAGLLGTTLFVVHAVTVTQTALSPEHYGQLVIGSRRAEFAQLLPPRTQSSPPPILVVPPAPAGARCEFYQARSSIFDITSDMFRLCFDDHERGAPVLVAKDHLRARGSR